MASKADISVALIVRHQEDDVWALRIRLSLLSEAGGGEAESQDGCEGFHGLTLPERGERLDPVARRIREEMRSAAGYG